MKKIYTFAALFIAGVTTFSGSAQVFAQSYDLSANDAQQVESALFNTCISPVTTSNIYKYPIANYNTGSIYTDYTISYQGGDVSPTVTDATIYPSLSYTPRTVATADSIISYQDTVNLSLNTDTSSYPTLSVNRDVTSSYPSISYRDSESTLVLSPTINNARLCATTVNTDTQVDSNTRYPFANITVNDTGVAYVEYDGSATVKWDSFGMTGCTLESINKSGTSGEYTLENITSNTSVTLDCDVSSQYPNYTVSPITVTIKVLPPTFDYIESYLTAIQPSNNKKVNLKSTDSFIEQGNRALEQGSVDRAQAFLQKSVDSIKRQGSKALSAADIDKYANAVSHLSNALPVSVVLATDGCSVTATGTPGLILQYGANKDMRMGYGDEATIPASGTITEAIYAANGWQSTAEVVDTNGLIYARDTIDVTTDSCPTPPVVYDPSTYNGYPEKWATPEVGTVIDDWGYYNKTAESYVAFRITDSGRTFPTGYGNASDWLTKATEDGYVVEYPQAGDIAINTLDIQFGGPIAWHVDIVDASGNYQTSAIRSDGNMNWSGGTVSGSSYLKYIRIP